MAAEIERKFLVVGDGWQDAESTYYCQGYLNRDRQRTVRVRIAGNKAMLTVKGINTGARREEYEYPIPIEDAKQMLEICERPIVEKYRRIVPFKGFNWEVDQFLGDNSGLIIAEIELESEEQEFDRPDWVGREVTYEPRYFNANLSMTPFNTWSDDT